MAKKTSAGIVLYRIRSDVLEVFLVHPGGPFWAKKDAGAWSIPKGEFEEGVDPLETAKREFHEETGTLIDGAFIELTPLRQPGGKLIYGWAVNGDIDASSIKSNMFSMEWPPRSPKSIGVNGSQFHKPGKSCSQGNIVFLTNYKRSLHAGPDRYPGCASGERIAERCSRRASYCVGREILL